MLVFFLKAEKRSKKSKKNQKRRRKKTNSINRGGQEGGTPSSDLVKRKSGQPISVFSEKERAVNKRPFRGTVDPLQLKKTGQNDCLKLQNDWHGPSGRF